MAKYYDDPTTGQRVQIKKTHKFRNFVVLPVIAVIGLFVVIHSATGSSSPGATPGNGPTAPAPAAASTNGHTVRYDVTGSGSGMITYITDGNGSTSQDANAKLPWSQQVNIDSFFAPLSVSVQHGMNSDASPVTCKITVDGKVISENHSSGNYAIASCSGAIK